MCGRYNLTASPEELAALFECREVPDFPPRYNIAPSQPVAVIRSERGERAFALMRWGLVPSWAKDPSVLPLLFNARSESAADKPAFRGAMRRRRCLIPATGFYEWQKVGKGPKLPHHIRRPDGGLFAFAGVWECWSDPQGGEIDTIAILTTGANTRLAPLHERMPVVVAPEDFARWLDAEGHPPAAVADILRPAPDACFEAYPVSTRVNSASADGPDIVAPLADAGTPPAQPSERPGGRPKKKQDSAKQLPLL